MDARFEHALRTLNHHRVALGGLAVAVMLGGMAGGALKPSGLLEEPMAAQLIASDAQASNAPPPMILDAFPADTANRPWVAGTDFAKAYELPRLSASYYDDPAYERAMAEATAMPDTTPSVADHAIDAVAEAPAANEPAA